MEDQKTPAPAETAGNENQAAPLSMEAALQEAEARLSKEIRKGQIIKGRVVFVGHDGVAVDVGTKVEGLIPFAQLTNEELPEEEL
ncbi:MAG TPA: S1 RNA-binding domain-containing protein, partial [Oceanithermus sp.]|nr:S1 RNA-binding domain-containing protein [Oceanithermus sp.]